MYFDSSSFEYWTKLLRKLIEKQHRYSALLKDYKSHLSSSWNSNVEIRSPRIRETTENRKKDKRWFSWREFRNKMNFTAMLTENPEFSWFFDEWIFRCEHLLMFGFDSERWNNLVEKRKENVWTCFCSVDRRGKDAIAQGEHGSTHSNRHSRYRFIDRQRHHSRRSSLRQFEQIESHLDRNETISSSSFAGWS